MVKSKFYKQIFASIVPLQMYIQYNQKTTAYTRKVN